MVNVVGAGLRSGPPRDAYLGTGSPGHQTLGACKPAFSLPLGSLAHDRRLRSDSYDSQSPGVGECGGCEGRSTAPLHSRSVRGGELNCRSSTQVVASTTNSQHCRFSRQTPTFQYPLTCQVQNRVRPFRVLLQDLDSFVRRQYLDLDFPAMSLAVYLFHYRQRSGPGADHKSPTLPGYLLFNRERCMPKPCTEPSGWLFLALADAASVDHDVVLVSPSVNTDRAK
jgi:hypothetical protein